MKFLTSLLLLLSISLSQSLTAQEFKFAFVTDTHIGASTSEEDLLRTVADINSLPDIDFAVITGDVTEMGTDEEIAKAHEILENLGEPSVN